MKKFSSIAILFFLLLIFSCSTKQIALQSQLDVAVAQVGLYLLENEVELKTSKAKPTILKSGTKWSKVGSISQGDVYRTKDQVVIVNSFNVHEGYIVVDEATVVGYYLPVEKTFVESVPTPIKFSYMEK